MTNYLKFLATILTIGILACIVTIGLAELNSRETTLIGIILAIVSILASWLISHIYAQSQHTQAIREVQEMHRTNLRTYALKAAEKVNNLSNELNRLVLYLEQAIAEEELESTEEALLARDERITSAIHIANTLKSVNDTSLSDWRGVIGEELEQQREEREEREAELTEMMIRVEALEKDQESDLDKRALAREIESIKTSVRLIVGGLSGTPFKYSRSFKPKDSVEAPCPVCASPVSYRHKPRNNSIKAVKCQSCQTPLVSKFGNEHGYSLARRASRTESVTCPTCDSVNEISLDSAPSSTTLTNCSVCKNPMRSSRSATDTINVRSVGESIPSVPLRLTEEILESVKQRLPPQPWPDGISRQIAQELKLSRETTHQAIRELIKRGMFKFQMDGILYDPISAMSARDGKEEAQKAG